MGWFALVSGCPLSCTPSSSLSYPQGCSPRTCSLRCSLHALTKRQTFYLIAMLLAPGLFAMVRLTCFTWDSVHVEAELQQCV